MNLQKDGFDSLLVPHIAPKNSGMAFPGYEVGLDTLGLFDVDIQNANMGAMRASAWQIASPMPLPPPVTMATLPLRSNMVLFVVRGPLYTRVARCCSLLLGDT